MTTSSRLCWKQAIPIAAFMAALMLIGAPSAGSAAPNTNPGIHPPSSKPYGASYSEWAAEWATWAFSFPVDGSPFLDADGSLCQQGQSPPNFFLASNFGGSTVRSCTIPAGQSVQFSPGGTLCILNTPDGTTGEQLRACVTGALEEFTVVSAEVDGVPLEDLQRYRVVSPLFSMTLPEGKLFGLEPGEHQGVIGGWFLIHTPLPVGQHVIRFHVEAPAFGLISDVTYLITVAPRR